MIAALALAGYVALAFVTWLFYLAVMMLKHKRHQLPKVAVCCGYVVLGIGYVLDVLFNLASSFLFLDFPRELLFTARVSRLKKSRGWRGRLADWFCSNLLNPIDDGHCG